MNNCIVPLQYDRTGTVELKCRGTKIYGFLTKKVIYWTKQNRSP